MELEDTIPYMRGDDRMRALAELFQLDIRIKALRDMLWLWDDDLLSYKPSTPKELSKKQLAAMESYREALAERLEYVIGIKSYTAD